MNKNTRTILWLLVPLAFMTSLVANSSYLYDKFCHATGFDGTTGTATALPTAVSDKEVTVMFSASTAANMPWDFYPEQKSEVVKLGAAGHAVYHVKNNSKHPVTGMASYNVVPEKAGLYFQKIQCFCFEKHTVQPGEQKDFPVLFFVDPSIADNPDTADVKTITLHYTYFEAKD